MRPSVCQAPVAAALVLAASVLPAGADTIRIPEGTAVELRLDSALSTRTSQLGDTFEATLVRPVYIDGQAALPLGTRVLGRVAVLHTARDGARSGVIGIEFTQLMLPGQEPQGIDGEMTSLRQDDRRKLIEEAPRVSTLESDVLIIGQEQSDGRLPSTLVGLRHSDDDDIAANWAKTGLGPSEVDVPKGAPITMEFDGPVTIPALPAELFPPGADVRHIFTAPATVKAVQLELARRHLYTGPAHGELDPSTRRALIRFQLEKRELPTGDVDAPTLTLLGVPAARRP